MLQLRTLSINAATEDVASIKFAHVLRPIIISPD